MSGVSLDLWHNWFWHNWHLCQPDQSLFSRIAGVVSYPIMALGSIASGTLVALRNRLNSKSVFNDAVLKSQFLHLTKRPAQCNTNAADENFSRNRYSDIKPYDHNRVRLQDKDFYFNASCVLGGKAIASQGPKPNEIDQFWQMIWEKDCSLIVMLTNFKEKGCSKCANYWPHKSKNFSISRTEKKTLYEEDSGVKIVKRTFQVKRGEETKTFTQLHLVNWPDHGVVSPETLKKMVELVHSEKKGKGPLLAHCSAGVGRTGAFLAAYEAYLTGAKRAFALVDSLRHERCWMVQKSEQFILVQRTIERFV